MGFSQPISEAYVTYKPHPWMIKQPSYLTLCIKFNPWKNFFHTLHITIYKGGILWLVYNILVSDCSVLSLVRYLLPWCSSASWCITCVKCSISLVHQQLAQRALISILGQSDILSGLDHTSTAGSLGFLMSAGVSLDTGHKLCCCLLVWYVDKIRWTLLFPHWKFRKIWSYSFHI